MSEEKTLKELSEQMGKTHEDFKRVNDQLEAEKKEYGEGKAQTKEMLERLNSRLDTLEVAMKRPPVGGDTTTAEPQDEKAVAYKKAFERFMRKGENRLTPDESKTLTVSDDTEGGFLAPGEFIQEIDKDVVEFSPIRQIARIRKTSRRSVNAPRREGTFTADWIGEGVTQAETEGLKYGIKQIHTHQLRALVKISSEDLEDPVFDLNAELRSEFSEQFGVAEGLAFVSGNGVTRPEGFLATASNKVTEQDTATTLVLDADDVIDMQFKNLKSAYWRNASWVMNRITIGRVRKLKDSDNQYLWQPGLNGPTQMLLLGFPIIEATDMNSTLDVGAQIMALGDFRRAYQIVDRIQMAIIRDPFTLADAAIVRFIARKRVGGQIVRSEAIVILKVKA